MKRETLHAIVNEIYGCEFTKEELKDIEYEYKVDNTTLICTSCDEVINYDEVISVGEYEGAYEFASTEYCPCCREVLSVDKPSFLRWCEIDKEGLPC